MQLSNESVPPPDEKSEVLSRAMPYEPTREDLLQTLAQVRQLVHAAAQPATTILLLIEIVTLTPNLNQSLVADLELISEQAHNLKNIIQGLRGLLEEGNGGYEASSPPLAE